MNNVRTPSLARIGAIVLLLAGLALPASAAGLPEGQRLEVVPGGGRFVGLVRNHYVRVANSVLLDATRAPSTMITRDTVHFVDVEFPERLPNGAGAILAQSLGKPDVQVGDIVEVTIAHRDNPNYFPVREVTRVTELVAKNDTMLARSFARNIALARSCGPLQQATAQPEPGVVVVNQ